MASAGEPIELVRDEDCCCIPGTPCEVCGEGLDGIEGITTLTITSMSGPISTFFTANGYSTPFDLVFLGSIVIPANQCAFNSILDITLSCDTCSGMLCVTMSWTDRYDVSCALIVTAGSIAARGCHVGGTSCEDPANIPVGGVLISNVVCDGIGLVSFDVTFNTGQGVIEGTYSR